MAQINKTILGKVRGTIGDITFRLRDGKSILSARPASFMPGRDPASIARRQKFALAVKLSQAINSVSELKPLWTSEAARGSSAFNRIMHTNYPMTSATGLSGLPRLTPSLGFTVSNPVVTLGPTDIKVNTNAIGDLAGIDTSAEPSLKLVSIVYLSNPADGLVVPYTFLRFVSETRDTDLASVLEFTFPLGDVETRMFAKYENKRGLFVLLTLDTTGNVVHHSNTFTG